MKPVPGRSAIVFAVGGLTLFSTGCSSGPDLEPWHTERLTAEFTAKKVDEVRTFDEYLELEDELFAQLEHEVYDHTETGPGQLLARYSAGSTADPRSFEPNWNRSIELEADDPAGGVLLLHGMSDSPYSLRALSEALHEHGYWVIAMRMPGHGTAPSGLRHIRVADMAAAVKLGVEHLAAKAGPESIHIVGYSTGAALAVDYALTALEGEAAPVPASLILISPAVGIHPAAALSGFKNGLSVLPGLGGLAWVNVRPEFDPYKYNSFATNAGTVVHRLTRSVASRVAARAASHPEEVLPPILVFKSTVDATVTTDAVVDRLLGRLAPERHEIVLFDINRCAVISAVLVEDPGPLTNRLMADDSLPFAVSLVTNESRQSTSVVVRRKPALTRDATETQPLDLQWPTDVISLSHVALPVPPDDPLYGVRPPGNRDVLFLGQMAARGESGLMKLPSDWLLRLRHNPFYDYVEARALDWVDRSARPGGGGD